MRAGLQAKARKVKAAAARAHAIYDRREMRTLSGKVPKAIADGFRRVCGSHGVTVHAIIAQMAEDSIKRRVPMCDTDTLSRARKRRRQR
jgi:hypothetical protein